MTYDIQWCDVHKAYYHASLGACPRCEDAPQSLEKPPKRRARSQPRVVASESAGKRPTGKKALVADFLAALKLHYPGCPLYVTEHRFHPKRRWRFDFAWPAYRIAVEVEGGVYSKGRHTRAKGYSEDCTKYNEAAIYGWRVLRLTRYHILPRNADGITLRGKPSQEKQEREQYAIRQIERMMGTESKEEAA